MLLADSTHSNLVRDRLHWTLSHCIQNTSQLSRKFILSHELLNDQSCHYRLFTLNYESGIVQKARQRQ